MRVLLLNQEDIEMLYLRISENEELNLKFNNSSIERFTECKLEYIKNGVKTNFSEDYLSIFVEDMLGRLENIHTINEKSMFGQMGKWQEYYYFDTAYNKRHSEEIKTMESSIFISAEYYGSFLYEYNGDIWFELDKGYSESEQCTPMQYYSDTSNYRVTLKCISNKETENWREQLKKIKYIIM